MDPSRGLDFLGDFFIKKKVAKKVAEPLAVPPSQMLSNVNHNMQYRQDKSSSAGHDGAQSVRERELIFRWNDNEGRSRPLNQQDLRVVTQRQ